MKKTVSKILAVALVLASFCVCFTSCTTKKTKLINPNATEETVKVFEYLESVYGEKTLSGVTISNGYEEYNVYKHSGGKRPAIMCFDMMQQTPVDAWHDQAVEQAIEWHTKSNGIVEFCWHWHAPSESTSSAGSFMTNETDFMPSYILTEGSDEQKWADRDIETVAKQFQKLQDAGVPVLFRPFHEASGGWFWWGREGAEIYKELWDYLYDKLTNEYGLNNLIWVWNGQSRDWYVGDDKCDIASSDIYYYQGGNPNKQYPYKTGSKVFKDTAMMTASEENYLSSELGELVINKDNFKTVPSKMVALSEIDQIPDPDKMFSDTEDWAPWLWFAPWYGGFSTDDQYVEYSQINKIYNHDRVVTLDELPEWDDDTSHELSSWLKNWIEKEGDVE